jgi:hypothetical protein
MLCWFGRLSRAHTHAGPHPVLQAWLLTLHVTCSHVWWAVALSQGAVPAVRPAHNTRTGQPPQRRPPRRQPGLAPVQVRVACASLRTCKHPAAHARAPNAPPPPPPRRLNAARHRVSNAAPVHRNPGMAIIYSESPFLVPAVFKRLVESWGVHSIVVFLTIRQVGWVGGWLMVCVRREAPLGKAGSHTTRGPSCCNSEVPKDQSTHTHTREHAHEHEKHTRTCTHRCRCRTCTSNSACCWRRSSTAAFTRLSRATATSTRSTRCGSRVESTAGLASM